MKIKALALVISATIVLLSFTLVSKSTNKEKAESVTPAKKIDVSGGLLVEDSNQWD